MSLMNENVDLVQKGFRILLNSLSGFIGREMNKVYRSRWWSEVLTTLHDQSDLLYEGEYSELIDSLDIANCIRLIDRKWGDVFRHCLPMNCRTWAKELMGARNDTAHIGSQDLSQETAERYLNTMVLLCREIDPDGADEIKELYLTIRKKVEVAPVVYTGAAQPESDSKRGVLKEGSLLDLVGTDAVKKTAMTRKVSYGGKTVIYPVYQVRLDLLFFNDQNDRIATWITQYESENGELASQNMDREEYNRIIEGFIYESNPDSIRKTQKNIGLIGQREPGVTLSDGRIVDGNRRFTCLRRMAREKAEPVYFETVIMDMDIREDKKRIKLLELAIQHGEEKKVDYDLIDYAVGTYRDIVQTQLLTVEEYASGTNESLSEVRNRLDVAAVICEFLVYLHLPEQYHAARELQVYSLFEEMLSALKKLNGSEKEQLKRIAFNNVLMQAIPDQKKFIRNIKNMINKNTYTDYFEEQKDISERIEEAYSRAEIHSLADVGRFSMDNKQFASEMQISMERALQRTRTEVLKNRPVENVNKSISLLREIDSRLFAGMDPDEKADLLAELEELSLIVGKYRRILMR